MQSQIQFFQKDMISLDAYYQHKKVSFVDVKRRLLLKQRELNTGISDNCYKLNQQKSFENIENFIDFFVRAIPEYVNDNFLGINAQKRIFVKENSLVGWQNLIADCSPLFLLASFLQSQHTLAGLGLQEARHIFLEYILKNSRYTALASPRIKPLDDLFEKNGGFYDLHTHLNGITESDAVWQSLLSDKHRNMHNISAKINTQSFKQQLEQLGLDYSLSDFLALIDRAKELRELFFQTIFPNYERQKDDYEHVDSFYNPFLLIVSTPQSPALPNEQLRYELLMYVLILKYLEKRQDEKVAQWLHEYLLIFGLFHQLLVQNATEFGFAQFQNITLNDIRSESDSNQLNKFLQLCGNDLKNVHAVGLRFSPKDSVDKQRPLLRQIKRDWEQLENRIKNENSFYKMPRYELIAHFIKQKDKSYTDIRFEKLRVNLEKKKAMLISLKNMQSSVAKKIVAVDAASSEFDTPPEVFAPIFNDLRDRGVIRHATYHAGEDFYHVLSGLRAIYESILYLHMAHGDRIGHATAAGIDIETWLSIVGEQILIPKGEYMDDLVFAYHIINTEHIEDLFYLLPFIDKHIQELCCEIYDESYPVSFLIDCWKLREHNPKNWDYAIKDKKEREFLEKYNGRAFRKKYEEPYECIVTDDFSASQLVTLQQALLRFMHKNEIVIEALPTSNLRIGYHRTLQSYQLFNWFKWQREGIPVPPIVFGTDDAGIFATNIYNEYALVYCYLVYEKKMNRSDVMHFLKEINDNSKIYAFKETE